MGVVGRAMYNGDAHRNVYLFVSSGSYTYLILTKTGTA
jgi:hypothetical protein